jgi:hypothetical protein
MSTSLNARRLLQVSTVTSGWPAAFSPVISRNLIWQGDSAQQSSTAAPGSFANLEYFSFPSLSFSRRVSEICSVT